ncbi:MAG TPA: hypothetical protein VMB84_04905 [Stellaceae bacterium]|nr:hypothetical protein [Stellaceae bacterium]
MTGVLVIADAATQFAVRRMLAGSGFTVLTEPGADARETPAPALILADLSGNAAAPALTAIRRRYPAARLLAIPRDLGMPFTPSQLLAAVRLHLARPGATTGSPARSPRPRSRRA